MAGSCHILQVYLLIIPFPRFKNTHHGQNFWDIMGVSESDLFFNYYDHFASFRSDVNLVFFIKIC